MPRMTRFFPHSFFGPPAASVAHDTHAAHAASAGGGGADVAGDSTIATGGLGSDLGRPGGGAAGLGTASGVSDPPCQPPDGVLPDVSEGCDAAAGGGRGESTTTRDTAAALVAGPSAAFAPFAAPLRSHVILGSAGAAASAAFQSTGVALTAPELQALMDADLGALCVSGRHKRTEKCWSYPPKRPFLPTCSVRILCKHVTGGIRRWLRKTHSGALRQKGSARFETLKVERLLKMKLSSICS